MNLGSGASDSSPVLRPAPGSLAQAGSGLAPPGDSSPPVIDESPVNTSCISVLFFGISIFLTFLKSIDSVLMFSICFGSILVILLIKGPLIALWTNRQLKQKGLKKNQQPKDIQLEELTLSAQARHSQLESYAIAEMH